MSSSSLPSLKSSIDTPKGNEDEEEDDDYMSMIIAEPAPSTAKETYTQRRIRKEREAEARGRVKSKREREADEKAAREAALAKSLLEDESAAGNKGLKMMAKMGFKPGSALGKQVFGGDGTERGNVSLGRLEPIGISMKEDKGGIGMDTEKKRKFREEMEGEVKRVKAEEGDYRERVRREREDARHEGLFHAAMRVAQRMSEEKEEEEAAARSAGIESEKAVRRRISSRPLKSVNLLWRGLVKQREEKERDRRMRHDLIQSLSRLPTYEDPNEDNDDKMALGKGGTQVTLVEDLEEEDPELDAFNELPPGERLQRVVDHLRETYCYCFWCKYTYPDKDMEGCPGLTEEDHD